MGILMHGCVGESIGPKLNFLRESANIDTTDVITSKSSTLPYDGDDMRRMIRLVQAAKGMLVFRKEENDRWLCGSEASGGLAYYTAGISE